MNRILTDRVATFLAVSKDERACNLVGDLFDELEAAEGEIEDWKKGNERDREDTRSLLEDVEDMFDRVFLFRQPLDARSIQQLRRKVEEALRP